MNEDMADKLFIFYSFLYLVFFSIFGWLWATGEPLVYITPEGQEVIEKQPESGPFQ